MSKNLKWVFRQWAAQKWFILIMVVFTLVSSAVSIAFPFIFKKLIDLLRSLPAPEIMRNSPAEYQAAMQGIDRIVMLFLAVGLAQLLTGVYPSFRALVNLRFEHSLRVKYFKKITTKDYRFFQKYRTGDIVTRLTDDLSDFPKISWFLCSGIFRAFNSFSLIAFSLIVMLSINWKLTLFSVSPLPLMMAVFYFTSDKLYKNFQKNQQAISEINNQLEMSFSGIRIVKAFVSEEKYNRFFDVALARRFKTEMSVVKLNAILHLIYEYIDYFAQIAVILFGGYMAVKGQITIGTFFLFYTYMSMMIYPLLDLPQLFVSGKQAFVNIDRLEEMKDHPSYNDKAQTGKDIDSLDTLRFDSVSCTYFDKTSPVITDCSFELAKGEKLLILGATGAGKSTIANMVAGLIPPSSGTISFNGIPLESLDLPSLRRLIGFVPQEPVLFGGTIKDNIFFAGEREDEQEYSFAVKASQLEEEIGNFPNQEMTVVGSRGLGVSGGQKQRITIARALYKRPELLILDDITASLDAENEEKLWQDVALHYPGISAIVISHRLSTLRYIDSVLFIDSNGVCHKGTHDELVFSNKEYHDFLHEHLKK